MMSWTQVDRIFVYPETREVVLGIELTPETYSGDPSLERSLQAKLDFYLTFIRDRRIEHYHPEAAGFTPWIEIAYTGTLVGDDLEVVTRLQQATIAKGIDSRLLHVEST